MNKKKKRNFWKNPWVIAIGSTLVTSLILRFTDVVLGTEIFYTVFGILSIPFVWIYSVLIIDIFTKVFVLILIFIAGGFFTFTVLYFTLRSNPASEDISPTFFKYTEDKFKNLVYRWEWHREFNGKYSVTNIIPLCPNCKCMIVYDHCPNCGNSYYGLQMSEREILALIYHKIDTINIL